MKVFFKALFLLISVMALPQLVFSQANGMRTVDLGDGYSIVVPGNWTIKRAQAGAFVFRDDSLILNVTTPTRLHALNINFADDSNVADVLAGLAFPFNGTQLNRDDAAKLRTPSRCTSRSRSATANSATWRSPRRPALWMRRRT
jgi:hypothetical protein